MLFCETALDHFSGYKFPFFNLEITQLFMVPRCCESASGSGGDAGWRVDHEEGGSFSEDYPTILCGHACHIHPPLYPPLLHGLSHPEGLRDQSLSDRTVRVSGFCLHFMVWFLSCRVTQTNPNLLYMTFLLKCNGMKKQLSNRLLWCLKAIPDVFVMAPNSKPPSILKCLTSSRVMCVLFGCTGGILN